MIELGMKLKRQHYLDDLSPITKRETLEALDEFLWPPEFTETDFQIYWISLSKDGSVIIN